ncbi:MAG TPA: hypothetical protein VLW55_10010 [Burkholderiaceae bacterium]|nr:hypothetical protein [Burkholderiaceae bacterium]
MQTDRWITSWTRRGSHTPAQPRARFSVTVVQRDAEPLQSALLERLDGRIERLVSAPAVEPGSREEATALHVVLERDAVDEAMHIVMSTACSARIGRVRRL